MKKDKSLESTARVEPSPEEHSKCSNPANFSYAWPGEGRSYICLEHFGKLVSVASAMGIDSRGMDVQLLTSSNIFDIFNWPECEQHER